MHLEIKKKSFLLGATSVYVCVCVCVCVKEKRERERERERERWGYREREIVRERTGVPLDPFVLSNRQLNVFIYVVVDTFTNRDPRDRILKKHSTERKLKNRGWVKKKTSMGVRAAFAVFLLFIATVEAEDGGVTFWGKEFTMTCPGKDGIKWYEGNGKQPLEGRKEGQKSQTANKKPYYFYVQGKVCDNCFELDSLMFLMAIVFDILMTICVMFIVYKCTKKKGPAGLTHASKPPPRSGGRGGPPVPSPDYEVSIVLLSLLHVALKWSSSPGWLEICLP
uniref:CD3 gamma/delta subunit Ig-like domain-containing protein n=1 Tax=Sparus aurata TaxID=8175 RepID=A0A671X820_SPAAU